MPKGFPLVGFLFDDKYFGPAGFTTNFQHLFHRRIPFPRMALSYFSLVSTAISSFMDQFKLTGY